MKKGFLLFLLFVVFINLSNADDADIKIFESTEKSIVYVEASFFLDKKDFLNHELIKRIENKYNSSILDSYLAIQTGSGFFITQNGYLLTNEHVIFIKDLNIAKIEAYNNVVYHILSKIPEEVLNASEYKLVKADIKKAIDNSALHYRVMVNNKNYFKCRVINSNNELDIAALKVNESQNFKAILLGESGLVKVGEKCISIGYPLATFFFELFKDLRSTMTIGAVSAVRSDNWGIQHTASINPGNSGGPLLNKNGEVIGVNVGLITNSSGLFFSIPVDKVKNWLNSCSLGNLIRENKIDSKKTGFYKNININFIEIGKNIFVDLPEGYKVYINNEYKGKTPLRINNLPSGIIKVRTESETEFSEQEFNVVKTGEDFYNYIPQTRKFFGKIIITTNPSEAKLYLDDIEIGLTPNSIDNINIGKHVIRCITEGYLPLTKEIVIKKNEVKRINEKLIKGVKITFKEKLPQDAVIKAKGSNSEYSFNSYENILLQPDKYEISIISSKLNPQKINIDLSKGNNFQIDTKFDYIKSKLIFQNLKKESVVYINNEDVTEKIKENSIILELGDYQLKIVTSNYKNFIKKFKMEKSKNQTITAEYLNEKLDYRSFKYAKNAMLGIGIPLISVGATLLSIGLIGYCVEEYLVYSKENSFYYNDPLIINQKNAFLAVMGTGAGLSSCGLIMLIVSIPINYYFKKLENYNSNNISLILDIDKSHFSFGLNLKL